ncbi:MAG: acyltransferase [Candidatus Obscuribacterales bacterium]|nr:acyltransferase [Candidatus Obscuribacterales bacterium]
MSPVAEISGFNLHRESGSDNAAKISDAGSADFKYQPALDGLRAIAVLFVMGFHSSGPIGNIIAKVGGWVGVDIFFVISGFLITSVLMHEKAKNGFVDLKSFYLRRMLRLMPAYYAFLACTAIFNPTHCSHIGAAIGIALVYLSNYDLVMGWNHISGSGTDITWSLALEEQFYLVWPTILNRLSKHLFKITIGSIIACELWKVWLLTHGISWSYLEAAFDTKVDTLMFGALGAVAFFQPQSRAWLNRFFSKQFVSLALFALLLVYVRAIGHPSGPMSVFNQIIYWDFRLPGFAALTTALLLSLCVQPRSFISSVLSHWIFTWLGKLSYSIYLWHGLSFLLLVSMLKYPLEKWQLEIAGYLTAIGFAFLSYELIEKPFLKMKSKLGKN